MSEVATDKGTTDKGTTEEEIKTEEPVVVPDVSKPNWWENITEGLKNITGKQEGTVAAAGGTKGGKRKTKKGKKAKKTKKSKSKRSRK